MGVIEHSRVNVLARRTDIDVGTEVRERGFAVVLSERRDGYDLRVHPGVLWGNVRVLVVVTRREHHDDVAVHRGLDSGAHAGVVAVHLPAAVDDVSTGCSTAQRLLHGTNGLPTRVVYGVRPVWVHPGL